MKYWLLIFSLIALPASADQIYLYVIIHDDNSKGERFRTKMADMGECLTVLAASKNEQPEKVSGDYEVVSVMWCGAEFSRNYNAHWWVDPTKSSEE